MSMITWLTRGKSSIGWHPTYWAFLHRLIHHNILTFRWGIMRCSLHYLLNYLIFMCKFAKRIYLRPWRIFLLFVASPCSEIQWIRRRLERTSIVKMRDHSSYWVQQRVSILTRVNIERCIRRKFAFSGGVLFWLASRTLCRFSKVVVNKKEFGKDSQGGEVGNGSSARFSSKKKMHLWRNERQLSMTALPFNKVSTHSVLSVIVTLSYCFA